MLSKQNTQSQILKKGRSQEDISNIFIGKYKRKKVKSTNSAALSVYNGLKNKKTKKPVLEEIVFDYETCKNRVRGDLSLCVCAPSDDERQPSTVLIDLGVHPCAIYN